MNIKATIPFLRNWIAKDNYSELFVMNTLPNNVKVNKKRAFEVHMQSSSIGYLTRFKDQRLDLLLRFFDFNARIKFHNLARHQVFSTSLNCGNLFNKLKSQVTGISGESFGNYRFNFKPSRDLFHS